MWECSRATGPLPSIVLSQGLQPLCPVCGAGPGIHCGMFSMVWGVVQCWELQCSRLQYITVQYITVYCITLYCRLIPCDCVLVRTRWREIRWWRRLQCTLQINTVYHTVHHNCTFSQHCNYTSTVHYSNSVNYISTVNYTNTVHYGNTVHYYKLYITSIRNTKQTL